MGYLNKLNKHVSIKTRRKPNGKAELLSYTAATDYIKQNFSFGLD